MKLTRFDVIAIRAQYARGRPVSLLAEWWGVTPQQVRNIVSRRQWREV